MPLFLDITLLSMLFFIGSVTSYEDIKYNRIRNKWIVLGLIWVLAVFLLLLVWHWIGPSLTKFYYFQILSRPLDSPVPILTYHFSFLAKSLGNLLVAVIVGFSMWHWRAWAAGDAKLFIIYAGLIPLYYYQKSYLSFFPSFVLLINIFCVFLFYLFISSLVYSVRLFWRKLMMDGWRKNFFIFGKDINWRTQVERWRLFQTAKMILFIFCIILTFNFLQAWLLKRYAVNIQDFQSLIFASFIFLGGKITEFLKKPRFFKIMAGVFILLVAGGLIKEQWSFFGKFFQVMKATLVFMFIFILFQEFINFFIKRNQTKIIDADLVQKGMELTPASLDLLGLTTEYANKRLAEEDEMVIKKSAQEKNIKQITAYLTCPFAFWMFMGVLITLFLKKSLINILFEFIKL